MCMWKVYSWSFNEKHKSNVTSTPTRVAGLSEKRIVDIACGSHHCLALTSDGQVNKGWIMAMITIIVIITN